MGTILLKDDVLWLDIPMKDPIDVQVLEPDQYTGYEELGLLLSEESHTANVISQVTT